MPSAHAHSAFWLAAAFSDRGDSIPAHAGSSNPQEFTQIERGRYLSILSDCGGCHTVPGGKPFVGGRADRNSIRQHRVAQYHA